jgi:hypothetical protein
LSSKASSKLAILIEPQTHSDAAFASYNNDSLFKREGMDMHLLVGYNIVGEAATEIAVWCALGSEESSAVMTLQIYDDNTYSFADNLELLLALRLVQCTAAPVYGAWL